jgi:hypothetical protein
MRGKILQYNGNDGTGLIVADGQQLRFSLANWKGDVVPAAGKTVEITVADGHIQTVMLVGDDVLMREKASELGGMLGGLVGGLGSTLAKGGAGGGGGAAVAGSIVERHGMPTLAAYGAFLVGTTMFKAVSIALLGAGWTLFQLAGFLSMVGGGGGIKMLLVLSYLSIGVPLVWRDRRGWLALLLPLLTMVWAIIKAMSANDGTGGGGPGPGDFGILGFYMPLAAAAFLGLTGFRKFVANA